MDQATLFTSQVILDILNAHATRLRSLGVVKIGLFGSQARGDARPDSDIDLLVMLADSTYATYCNVLFYLEDLFEREIDLVPEDSLKPRLRPYVMSEVQYAEGL